jgi:hypothetical protein
VIKAIDQPNGPALPENFEYETLPYFFNSLEEEMHEI